MFGHRCQHIYCDDRFFFIPTGPVISAENATITGENSSVKTTCSRNGNLSGFPGTQRPASVKLATDVKN